MTIKIFDISFKDSNQQFARYVHNEHANHYATDAVFFNYKICLPK